MANETNMALPSLSLEGEMCLHQSWFGRFKIERQLLGYVQQESKGIAFSSMRRWRNGDSL